MKIMNPNPHAHLTKPQPYQPGVGVDCGRQALTGRRPPDAANRHRTPEGCQKPTAFRHELSVFQRERVHW